MLACDPRRQHLDLDFYPTQNNLPSPSPSHSSLQFFQHLAATACTPSPSEFNGKALSYFHPSLITSDFQSLDQQYMSGAFHDHPAIRIEQSTPTPALSLSTAYPQQPTPVDNTAYNWGTLDGGNGQMVATATPTLQTPIFNNRRRSHQRASSSSSIGSSGSSSPFSHGHATSSPLPYDMTVQSSKLSQSYNLEGSRQFGNHLPTPTQTPTQDSFIPNSYHSANTFHQNQSIDSATAATMAMNRMMMEQAAEDDVPAMSHSSRHSVSSLGQEPSTPHDGYDGLRLPSNADNVPHHSVPKLDRTMTDIYADEGFYPSTSAPAPVTTAPSRQNSNYLSPHQTNVNQFLQAAQMARSHSPMSATASRDISPFRPDSPWATVRMHTAAQQRETQLAQASMNEKSAHMSPNNSTPKTISPKDAVLDYHPDDEAAKASLFPDAGEFDQQTAMAAQLNAVASHGVGANWPTGAGRQIPTANFATQQMAAAAQQPQTPFAAFPHIGQSYGHRASLNNMAVSKQEETPEFPAHLTSMESSVSEAAPQSSQTSMPNTTSMPSNFEAPKPANISSHADTGTYTCTYHGCSLRFETPQKLQRHKREGHRQVTAQQQHTPGVGSGMTSAALSARNSQAGPHKCERINPTTGKPCNVVFSRPYDLTRHEDTIHNVRKTKVRCALCVEEKTFSRNDALTRHMRVVHPEVDFPGKHRRRGSRD